MDLKALKILLIYVVFCYYFTYTNNQKKSFLKVVVTPPLKKLNINIILYTEFILVRLCRKLLAYKTLESVPGPNQY